MTKTTYLVTLPVAQCLVNPASATRYPAEVVQAAHALRAGRTFRWPDWVHEEVDAGEDWGEPGRCEAMGIKTLVYEVEVWDRDYFTVWLPRSAWSYLLDGDATGLTNMERDRVDAFAAALPAGLLSYPVGDGPAFMWCDALRDYADCDELRYCL